ncbi:MAG: hypothetical protein EB092_03080 [Chitinophagia bacterium]|nr:hypothetical protein [Chitinophagia bacterium]NDD15971.1 hypothetical protein [Chitinophagia bacterium]
MKIKTSLTIFISSISVVILFFSAACLKQTAYAQLVIGNDTDSLISIKALRKLHNMGSIEPIVKSMVLEATIVANDEHDNLYKSISIQDTSGGILINLDGSSLYQTYTVGTTIRIRLQNLFLTDYRRMLQLVASVDTSSGQLVTTGIPAPLFSKYIKVVKENVNIVPMIVSYKNLGDSLQGRLIKISNVEFSAADTNSTYADKKNKIGASKSLKFCSGGTIYLRTSGYADFAGISLPKNNGDIVGIYSVYNYEKQLLLRDTSDILFRSKRCTGAAWLKN